MSQFTEKEIYIHKANSLTEKYAKIPNDLVQRKDISWAAKGLLVYLLSLPEDFRVYKTEVQNHSSTGREATRRAFEELIDLGFIESKIIPGRPPENVYLVYYKPSNDLRVSVNPKAESRKAEIRTPAISAAIKETSTTKETITKKTEQSTHTGEESSFEKIFEKAFDEDFLKEIESSFAGGAAAYHLSKFKSKVKMAPAKYKDHDHESMRRAFMYHLQNRPGPVNESEGRRRKLDEMEQLSRKREILRNT